MTPYGPLASGASGGPVAHSYWVVAGALVAGARPTDGSSSRAGLVRAGIDVIVDLTGSGRRDRPEMDVRLHPIADFGVPSVAEMASILDTIDGALDADRGVFVHCLAGVGRTGTVVGCWLIRHGACSPGKAIEVIARLRGQAGLPGVTSPETGAQVEFVESWESGT